MGYRRAGHHRIVTDVVVWAAAPPLARSGCRAGEISAVTGRYPSSEKEDDATHRQKG